MRQLTICVDFDGTCVTHEYPKIGKDIGAQEVLKKIIEHGHRIVLWTMRSDKTLEDAVEWFSVNGIPLFGVNNNPEQNQWTKSPKAYGQIYIDDAALGCPLLYNGIGRPFVDWRVIENTLKEGSII